MGSNYFRPRGALARTFYDKLHKDHQLRNMDKSQWYLVDEKEMKGLSLDLWGKFHKCELDDETESFLDNCFDTSDSFCWQLWLTFANSVLSWFLSPTSINGLLGRGSMYVFSGTQFKQLIDLSNDGLLLDSLLDVGAGDGSTTDRIKRYFNKVYVTEMSKPMKWSLANKGFIVLDELTWNESSVKFDAITCLNVLDRCDRPLQLLDSIQKTLKPTGVAIVSFVIPFNPYVEFGGNDTHDPAELLPISAKTFNQEVNNFVGKVLIPNGWEVLRWTRLPYLCQGNIQQAFYWLNDAVFVMKPKQL
ncbi:unnamed protein product [Allacma fusca]|uniref:Methyltransferase-like protein 9 n=1 Tax=Allacma fusca TaxID=39272 RepID=A0A8J2PZ98_9HEXA|nr:unnamed protein product [Allacma fusca]